MRALYFNHEIKDQYEELLNENYPPVSICGYMYDAGRALRLIDETAFDCDCSAWEGDEFDEVTIHDMSDDEIDHYMPSDRTVMYCRKDENEVDEEE